MFCNNCGSGIKDDAKFCPFCGVSVDEMLVSDNMESTGITFKGKKPFYNKKYNKFILIIILILALALIGYYFLGQLFNGDGSKITPYFSDKYTKDTALLFSKTSGPYDDESGDLYSVSVGKEPEKVASNVLLNVYTYLPEPNIILYVNSDYDFYMIKDGSDPEKLGSDVIPTSIDISLDGTAVAFLERISEEGGELGELYFLKLGEEKVKIDAQLYNDANTFKDRASFMLSDDGNALLYIDLEGNFYQYDYENPGQKEKVASNVLGFKRKGDVILFTKNDDTIYVKWSKDTEAEKYFDSIGYFSAIPGEVMVFYDSEAALEGTEIYLTKKDLPKVQLATEMKYGILTLNNKYVIMMDIDNNLYYKEIPSNLGNDADSAKDKLQSSEKVKIASDVSDFRILSNNKSVAWKSSDDALFYLEFGMNQQKLASDIQLFTVVNDIIIYTTNDDATYNISKVGGKYLSGNAKLVGGEADGSTVSPNRKYPMYNTDLCFAWRYYAFRSRLGLTSKYTMYSTSENELLYLKIGGQPQLVLDLIDEYDSIQFDGMIVYERGLNFKDIAGKYKLSGGIDLIVEIKADGTYSTTGKYGTDTYKLTINENGTDYINAVYVDSSSSFDFTRSPNSEIDVNVSIIEGEGYFAALSPISDTEYATDYNYYAYLEKQYDELYNVGLDMKQQGGYTIPYGTPVYLNSSYSSKYLGYSTISLNTEVVDFIIDDDFTLWLNLAYNGDYIWIPFDTPNMEVDD